MMNIPRLALLTALLVVSSGWMGHANRLEQQRGPAPRPPNVVIVFADDLGYADVNSFGPAARKPRTRTPNLDRMAAEGVRLTSFYVAQAVCSASRAALLTGAYPNRIGITGALNHTAAHGLNPDEITIAEVLKQRGYGTAIFGKWHLGHEQPFLPLRHGFDEYLGLPYSNDMWPRHPQRKGLVRDMPAMTIDLMPTIATLAGAQAPARGVIDGRDIWPLLANERNAAFPHEALYFYWGTELHAIRSGRWKLHLPHPFQALEAAGTNGMPGKYVTKQLELSLFDLEKDPGETTNVAAGQPEVVSRLRHHVERAREDLGDSLTKRAGKNVRPPGRLR